MIDARKLPSPDRPDEALAAVAALRRLADRLERQAVAEAVKQGWTWADISETLGITRQAAHARHAKHLDRER